MNAFPEIEFSESRRQYIASTLIFGHLLFSLNSFVVIGNGINIKFVVEQHVSLTNDYNDDFLPWVMILVGIMNLIINVIGAVLSYRTYDIDKRGRRLRLVQLPYLCFAFFAMICLFAVGLLALSHQGILHASYMVGIIEAMKRYKTNMEMKTKIDRLQTDFRCCGSETYHDWFQISWISNHHFNLNSTRVQKHLIEGQYYSDDVPFSCCQPRAMRPCIHHFVLNDSKHFNYRHKVKTTLYEGGCHEALMDYFAKNLKISTLHILMTLFAQLLLIVQMRFLQTSVYEAIERGDPELDAPGWLIGYITSYNKPIENELNVNDNDNAKKCLELKRTKVPNTYKFNMTFRFYPVYLAFVMIFILLVILMI